MDYAAEARLICDNLCDFSHLSYVHAGSFGASETWARTRPRAIELPRGVRFERWIVGEPRMRARGQWHADVWSCYEFLVPGILLMGGAALATMVLAGGQVKYLIVLYSINVFITFFLSQLGMVRHWWQVRGENHWKKKLIINGLGMTLTFFILVSVTIVKFHDGGWITILLTGTLVGIALLTRRHYVHTFKVLKRLDELVTAAEASCPMQPGDTEKELTVRYDPQDKTAILLVNGFNGLGLHTLFSIIRLFGGTFKNFVFIQIGVVDAGNFKGTDEVAHMKAEVRKELDRYVHYMRCHGYYSAAYSSFGNDVVDEVARLTPEILDRFPNAILFGGQLVFPKTSFMSGLFHNYTIFAVQRRFYNQGIPVVILPIRV